MNKYQFTANIMELTTLTMSNLRLSDLVEFIKMEIFSKLIFRRKIKLTKTIKTLAMTKRDNNISSDA